MLFIKLVLSIFCEDILSFLGVLLIYLPFGDKIIFELFTEVEVAPEDEIALEPPVPGL
jgi:hypothetical protein